MKVGTTPESLDLVEHEQHSTESTRRRDSSPGEEVDQGLISRSLLMRRVQDLVARAAQTSASVLVTGETGTGKELVAHAIHRASAQRDEPMMCINVSALPIDIVESELFGHMQRAFTGAHKARLGMLRAAGKGTLFLDEIGELDPIVQAKLLRVLENREVRPLGGDGVVPFEARIVCATNRDLLHQVELGRFREDLFYRLDVLRITVPPLRDRIEDIPPLARLLLDRLASRRDHSRFDISQAAIVALCHHDWPGNVRELGNVLERASLASNSGCIETHDLQVDVAFDAAVDSLGLRSAVERFEREHISRVLRLCEGRRDRAAVELCLSPATLYRKLDRLGLRGYASGHASTVA